MHLQELFGLADMSTARKYVQISSEAVSNVLVSVYRPRIVPLTISRDEMMCRSADGSLLCGCLVVSPSKDCAVANGVGRARV